MRPKRKRVKRAITGDAFNAYHFSRRAVITASPELLKSYRTKKGLHVEKQQRTTKGDMYRNAEILSDDSSGIMIIEAPGRID